ncbi:MAG: aconitate hydratase [Thermodesulfobacteriota bacterium]|jgi:aconitate hydratase
MNLFDKIVKQHLWNKQKGNSESIPLKVDQILTQDATGTMVYLQFEAIGQSRIQVPLAVSYVDHNTLQADSRNPDDHRYLQTAAARYGAYFSPAGNGISHQIHLERFAKPGQILLGSDSHTPTAGGLGTLAMGCGGLDIAAAMAGFPYHLLRPKVRRVWLTGQLNRPWVTAMDVALEMLRRLTVRGGLGWVNEFNGPGVSDLSVTERATICNLGAELGATSSLFPSDGITRSFLKSQGRAKDWRELQPDPEALYDGKIEIHLNKLEPLAAKPFSPDHVVPLKELTGLKVDQVCIGSCSNSSYAVLKSVAVILSGKTIHPHTSLLINPGSRQVLLSLAVQGDLFSLVASGARILECACGPCIGMGGAPSEEGVSFRTFNRNFKGRSGTLSARVFLCNPLAAALIALKGEVVDPMCQKIPIPKITNPPSTSWPHPLILSPSKNPDRVKIIRGPNIKPIPSKKPISDTFQAQVLIKTGDHISTDDILPGGSEVLPFRSNIPAISRYTFSRLDPHFADRVLEAKGGVIVGGENYGQGSSREHAVLAPMFLGIQAVIAKSFARIHLSNLINYGILPLVFINPVDYDSLDQNDRLKFKKLKQAIRKGQEIRVVNQTKQKEFALNALVPTDKIEMLLAGGLLPYIKKTIKKPRK